MSQLYSVSYERKLSDGKYGSEGMTAAWTWEGSGVPGEMEQAAEEIRAFVLGHLARSADGQVAAAARHELRSKSKAAPNGEAVAESLEDTPF